MASNRAFNSTSITRASVFAQAKVSATVRLLDLNDLRDLPGAIKKTKRVGRGPGSGLGKTCGRGHKGTGQRRALGKRGFEGGQTPLWKRTPKRGALRDPRQIRVLQPLGLGKLLMWIKMGRVDPAAPLTMKALNDSGVFGNAKIKHGVKLLGTGASEFVQEYQQLGLPVPKLEVSDASAKAVEAVEQVGGSVELVWFARVPLRAHLKPEKFDILPRSNGVPPRKLRAKYNYEFPKDRIYTGEEKRKTFSPRIPFADQKY